MPKVPEQLGMLAIAAAIALVGSVRPAEPEPLTANPIATVHEHSVVPEREARPLLGPVATPTLTVRATGYNSLASQTDSTPFITATGTRTRFGIVAVSRDLLGNQVPYGSLIRLRDLGTFEGGYSPGYYQSILDGQGLFIVEDTMHARKTQQVDIWFEELQSALNWGVRRVQVQVVRYGYDGPTLDPAAASETFDVDLVLAGVN